MHLGEDEDEVPIFESHAVSKNLVKSLRSCESLTDVLQHLLDEKPIELNFGGEHYLDLREIKEYMNGLCLKLKIHGYDDRGERLKYLYLILSSKLAKKEDTLKNLVQFLMISSQRPTAVTHLELKSVEYSPDPDEDSVDEDSIKQRALLMKILSEERDADHEEELHYSSGSELSEWSTDEESTEEKSNNDIPPIVKIRHSSSFGEFSDVTAAKKEDPEKVRQEIQLYWSQQKCLAESYLRQEVRKFDIIKLRSQPVISSLLVLQSRFGEFWEWKKYAKEKQELFVTFEEDVVREILWQFIVSDPQSSPIFTSQWLVKSNLMLATLSKSTFTIVVNKFGKILSILQGLRKFAGDVEESSQNTSEEESCPPSKVFRNYAAGILEISRYIVSFISKLERELNRTCRYAKEKGEPACTTLIRLERKTASLNSIINLLHDIHSKSIHQPNETQPDPEPWLSSLKLISCLEAYLLLETNPDLYGVLLFLYSKCLYAFLDDIISTLSSMKWDERYSLFVRNPDVHLNDSNFWSECIQIRDYKTILISSGIFPLICLDRFLPKVLNILKTCEVLDQLEENFSQILSKSNLNVSDVIHEFVEQNFSMSKQSESMESQCNQNQHEIDFLEHFAFIGLESSDGAGAFRFLTATDYNPKFSNRVKNQVRKFEDFLEFSVTPFQAHTEILEKVLDKWFSPFSNCAKESIQKIFQDYKVLESMKVFQEIILTVREDFAKSIIEIASNIKRSDIFTYEDCLNRNPKFQVLLNECYPEGREIFSVDLTVDSKAKDSSSEMNFALIITPHFPLNLIVTPKSVAGYLFIGRQLHRIRKSLWDLSSLNMKACVGSEDVDVTRTLMFRFCLINFCSSLRSFFTLKLFSKDFSDFAKAASYEDDLDCIRRIHEEYLESIKTRMLRNPLIESIIIRKVVVMSDILRKGWSVGISQVTMRSLEDTLKKCWQVVNDFESTKYSYDFNELSYHFGPPPTCLS